LHPSSLVLFELLAGDHQFRVQHRLEPRGRVGRRNLYAPAASPSTLARSPLAVAFTNLYSTGAPQEAIKVTADAAFGALATWLSEQQRLVERAFEARSFRTADGASA
jgi:hypothetical protein